MFKYLQIINKIIEKENKMLEVLVLGANGQLGSDLVKVFTANKLAHTAITQDDFDLLKDDVDVLVKKHNPKVIINCIATTDVDGAETNSSIAFEINTNFVYKLAKICQENTIILFHISTDYVFDGLNSAKYDENATPKPLNIYGLSKYSGELALQQYHDKFFIFRVAALFGIAGAAGKGGNFITTMQRLGRERDEVAVISDQITCPTSTLDVARCIYHFITNKIDNYGIYHCVSNNSCSWFEFTQEIFKLSNLDVNKVKKAFFAEYRFKAKRPQHGILDTTKLSKYYQMPTWESALREYISLKG